MEDKCCENCKHFKYEGIEGWGACVFTEVTNCSDICAYHVFENNGWTEITPDNVDLIPDNNRIIVTDGQSYNNLREWHLGVGTMAKYGGYYYYVLPELKIE